MCGAFGAKINSLRDVPHTYFHLDPFFGSAATYANKVFFASSGGIAAYFLVRLEVASDDLTSFGCLISVVLLPAVATFLCGSFLSFSLRHLKIPLLLLCFCK